MHGAISIVFLGCIALVWLAAVRGRADGLAIAALAALGLECVLVVVAGGNCPLGPLLRRIGDDTPLFELVLPPRAAKAAIPVLGVVAIAGAVTLAFRTL